MAKFKQTLDQALHEMYNDILFYGELFALVLIIIKLVKKIDFELISTPLMCKYSSSFGLEFNETIDRKKRRNFAMQTRVVLLYSSG